MTKLDLSTLKTVSGGTLKNDKCDPAPKKDDCKGKNKDCS